jgi:putative oxidoreductase
MAASERQLLIPGLAGFYQSWGEISYTIVRVVIGAILLTHGWIKYTGPGLHGITGFMAKHGLEPAIFFAGAAIFLETIGAICVIIGLFTRFFAAAIAIELAVAFLVVNIWEGRGPIEATLLLGVVMFAIAIRGGGPYSLDRLIGKEL